MFVIAHSVDNCARRSAQANTFLRTAQTTVLLRMAQTTVSLCMAQTTVLLYSIAQKSVYLRDGNGLLSLGGELALLLQLLCQGLQLSLSGLTIFSCLL